jgi:xylose isomerase
MQSKSTYYAVKGYGSFVRQGGLEQLVQITLNANHAALRNRAFTSVISITAVGVFSTALPCESEGDALTVHDRHLQRRVSTQQWNHHVE